MIVEFVTAFLSVIIFVGASGHFNPYMDSVHFAIDWAGADDTLWPADITSLSADESSSVIVTTSNKEKYQCLLPKETDEHKQEEEDRDVAHTFELDLLKPLFEQTACTYRLETYWTYELCHGKHLRQYHEEKELGKKTRLTEYFLGRYKTETFRKAYEQAKEEHAKQRSEGKSSFRNKKVQGAEIQYYEVVYEDGTLCDLTGRPRRAAVQYVCQPDGRGEIYELKETSSCEYEVVVLTSLLCSHAGYGSRKEHINTIQCRSLGSSPRQPASVDLFENNQWRYNSKEFWNMDLTNYKIIQDEENMDNGDESAKTQPPIPPPQTGDHKVSSQIGEHTDKQILKEFLSGDFCIHGGTGWWQYEFCYGRHVLQFHEARSGKVVIVLGEWDTAAHLLWISNNPRKRPAPVSQRKTLRHYYSNGNFCEASGKNRVSEVKLRCIENPSLQHSMAIYVLEPKTCEYQVVVESPLLCSIISQANSDGLIQNPQI